MTALVAAQILIGPPLASAHTHPTAVDLDSPGVVYVQTTAHVDISLIEPDTPTPGHIRLTRKSYDPVLSAGSGFAVNPSGYIVTSAQTVSPDRRPAEIFAVNHLFAEHYSSAARLPFAEYAQQHLAVGGRLDKLLQRCYRPNTTDVNGGCVVRTTLRVVVYPFVTSQTKDGTLSAAVLTRHLTHSPDPAVAVLKIAANSMPTVKMTSFDVSRATSATSEIPGAVLGFTGIPGTAHPLKKVNTHVIPKAGTAKSDDLKELVPLLTQGLRGGPIVADQQKIVGFYPWNVVPPGSAAGTVASNPPLPKLVDGVAILAVLKAVGVQALRGPTDIAFEDALHGFNNAEYAAALPALKRTLQLYGGHFTANADLKEALAKQGTAADLTGKGTTTSNPRPSSGGGGSHAFSWVVAVVVAAAALLGSLALLMVRRRGRPGAAAGAAVRSHPGSAGGSTAAPSAAGVHPPTASGAAPGRSGSAAAGRGSADAGRGGQAGAPAPRDPAAAGRPSVGAASMPAARQKEPAGVGVRPSRVTTDPPAPAGEPRTFCTSCGQRLAPNHQFCGWCGHRVG